MATTPTDTAPVVDVNEMNAICAAIILGDLPLPARARLRGLLNTFAALDGTDPDDRHDRDMEHATNWRVARKQWREFVAAFRAT